MLEKVGAFFENVELYELGGLDEFSAEDIQLIGCVLLVHVAFLDRAFPESEQHAIVNSLVRSTKVSEEDAAQLVQAAAIIRMDSPKLKRTFDILNAQLNVEQRKSLYAACWEVIKADGIVEPIELQAATELGARLNLTVDQEIEVRRALIGSESGSEAG